MIMENKDLKTLNNILDILSHKKLGTAISTMHKFAATRPTPEYDEELNSIERDYRLMLGYMKRGFNDPQRGNIYDNLIYKMSRLTRNIITAHKTRTVPFFTEAARQSAGRNFSREEIKSELENFVADAAMLSLEIEPAKTEKSRNIYSRHYAFMQALFGHIIVSELWNDADRNFYKEIILSPTTDTNDAQLITSAVTIAAMNNPDAVKTSVLIDIYLETGDEKIKQKALVGWVFALPSGSSVTDEIKAKVAGITENDDVRNELAELQKQMIYCMNAEEDTNKIQRDIMPDLMKNNNLRITRFGISEKEEDPMQDVFDPGASERTMEKMEESFAKMMNMQKAGSDIYFGGFSQMKRFPFFYTAANWFCPFFIEHPGITETADKLKDTPLLSTILENGPFCDSDKYSFTLAVASVISHLPTGMREMFNSKEVLGQTISNEEQKSATYIRRMILQDMYRFFRLYPQRAQLVNPFDVNRFTFVADKMFNGTKMSLAYPDLCYFMIKHKNKTALKNIMAEYECDKNDPKSLLIHGLYELDFTHDYNKAAGYLKILTGLEPDNRRATALLARSCFECGDYVQSADCYGRLYDADPGSVTTALNYCTALSKAKKYNEAVNLLYKLDIEHPDSMPVTRVLAWTLLGLDKYEQAEKAYNRLLKSDDAETGDWLNAGYCQWFKGDIGNAVKMFKKFTGTDNHADKGGNLTDEFNNDRDILADHNISDTDILLMADIVSGEWDE